MRLTTKRLFSTLAITALGLALSMPSSFSHTKLVSANPAGGSVITQWPEQISIEFDDAMNVKGVVMISSVLFKSIDQRGAIKAEVPLLTDMQSFKSNLSFTYCSKISLITCGISMVLRSRQNYLGHP